MRSPRISDAPSIALELCLAAWLSKLAPPPGGEPGGPLCGRVGGRKFGAVGVTTAQGGTRRFFPSRAIASAESAAKSLPKISFSHPLNSASSAAHSKGYQHLWSWRFVPQPIRSALLRVIGVKSSSAHGGSRVTVLCSSLRLSAIRLRISILIPFRKARAPVVPP